MSNFNSADIAAFKDVWVFCEQREGKLMPTDFELISKGRDLADELGVNLCGLLLGGAGAFVLVKYRRNSARHRADNDFMLDDDDESAE